MTGARRWTPLVIAAALFVAHAEHAAYAQEKDPHAAQPERPTVATHAGTVAKGWFEIETGVERDSREGTAFLAPMVLKFGIAPRMQLTVAGQGLSLHPDGASSTSGVGDVSVGIKWRVLEDAPVLGDFAILPTIKFPTGSTTKGTGTGTTDGGLLLISSHDIHGVALDINAGLVRRSGDGLDAPKTWSVWTVSTGGPLAGALGFSAEVYGYPGTSGVAGSQPIVALLVGPTWTVRDALVLDAGLIAPVQGPQPRALYAGLTWNVGRIF